MKKREKKALIALRLKCMEMTLSLNKPYGPGHAGNAVEEAETLLRWVTGKSVPRPAADVTPIRANSR